MSRCERRASPAALLLLLLLLVRSGGAQEGGEGGDADPDEESDSVAYMIIIEHGDGWQCAGALVSLHTALSSARCARPRRPRADLWALAAALVSKRRPASLKDAARRVVRVAIAGDGRDPADPALDMAVLELEEPFGEGAQTKPILMATMGDECESTAACNTVRVLHRAGALRPGARALRLRVVSVQRGPSSHCAARIPHWAAARNRLLCLHGETLCESELGGGVVCAGLLCGVLSASGGAGAGAGCGDTHAAHAVARWRRFLHCAHTQRLCGRGDCKALCTEQWLGSEEESIQTPSPTTAAPRFIITSTTSQAATASTSTFSVDDESGIIEDNIQEDIGRSGPAGVGSSSAAATRTQRTSRAAGAASAPPRLPTRTEPRRPPPVAPLYDLRPAADFEPNRADFKSSSKSTRPSMRLKAGEYGDNAAEYGAPGEDAPPPSATRLADPAPPPRAPPPPPPAESRRRSDTWLDHLAQADSETQMKKNKKSCAIVTHMKIMVFISNIFVIFILNISLQV